MLTFESKLFYSAILGNRAFKNGFKCIPCLDKNLRTLLEGVKDLDKGIALLDIWRENWNLAKKFENSGDELTLDQIKEFDLLFNK